MPIPLRSRTPVLLLAAAIGIPAIALLMPLPRGTRVAGIVLNFGHVALGGVVCLLLWRALRALINLGLLGRGALAWLGAMAVLGGMELMQVFSDTRSPQLGDIVANGLGATAALLFLVAAGKRLGRRLAVAALPVAIAFVPVGLTMCDAIRQRAEFPMLADFESQLELSRWQFRSVRANRTDKFVKHGQYAFDLTFNPADWPAAQFAYVSSDWRGYEALAFDMHVDEPQRVWMHVMDAWYDGTIRDRFTRSFELSPGWNAIRVDMSEIVNGIYNRKLDLTEIHSIQWYLDHPTVPVSIRLDAIRLER